MIPFLVVLQAGFKFPMFPMDKSTITVPSIRTSFKDRHIALSCMDDIHCPKGSRCYVPLEFPKISGVCVVTYDSKFVGNHEEIIWNTDS